MRRPVAGGDVRLGVAVDALFDRGLARIVVSAPSGDLELEPGAALAVGNHVLRPAV